MQFPRARAVLAAKAPATRDVDAARALVAGERTAARIAGGAALAFALATVLLVAALGWAPAVPLAAATTLGAAFVAGRRRASLNAARAALRAARRRARAEAVRSAD